MIRVVNMIPRSMSGEVHQDSEPNLAVNPLNPRQIAASAFIDNPMGGTVAPILVSTDGGRTWLLNANVPSGAAFTSDISVRFAPRSNNLYAGILVPGGGLRMMLLRTDALSMPTAMTVLVDRLGPDQPYVQTAPMPGHDRVLVGNNDFGAGTATATVDVSQAAEGAPPAGLTPVRIETRATMNQDGPAVRPVAHWDGTAYAAFYRWTARGSLPGDVTVDVVVVRDDAFGSSAQPFAALTDPSDNRAGRLVATRRTLPFANQSQPAFGQERMVGSNISIAVDPWNSRRVYLAWADEVDDAYTLHVRRSLDRGNSWSSDLRTVANATNPALAVTDGGVLAFMYQELVGDFGSAQRWVTRLERTLDEFERWDPRVLADVPADVPRAAWLPYIGDYIHLLALGDDLYGVFSANNTPDPANFPSGVTYQRNADFSGRRLLGTDRTTPVDVSIDPFFVKATGQLGVSAVTTGVRRLDTFVVGTDGACFHKRFDGSAWRPSVTGYESLSGTCVGPPTALVRGANGIELFVVGTDQAVWHKWWDGSSWGPSQTGWERIGGNLHPSPFGPPVAVSWAHDRIDLFAVGSDNSLLHRWWDGSAWAPSGTAWESLGGTCAGRPAAVAWGSNRLDLFVVGVRGALLHKWWDGSAWRPSTQGWESLGGVCMGTPVAVSWAENRLDLFVVGTNRNLFHKWWDGSAWRPSGVIGWESLGGDCASQPAAVTWAENRLDVFVLGTDRALYHKWWNGSAWRPSLTGPWESLGGPCHGTPVATAWAPRRLDLFMVGPQRDLKHKWFNGSEWRPGVGTWESLGGTVDF